MKIKLKKGIEPHIEPPKTKFDGKCIFKKTTADIVSGKRFNISSLEQTLFLLKVMLRWSYNNPNVINNVYRFL